MEVQTQHLELIFQKVISKLRESGIESVTLNQDMYWFLSNKESYAIQFDVKNPLLGSLSDDWNELKKVAADKQVTTFADFERIAYILKAIAEELNPE